MRRIAQAFVFAAAVATAAVDFNNTRSAHAAEEPPKNPQPAMTQSEPMKVAGLELVTSVEQRIGFSGAAREVAMELLVKNVSDKAISISVNDVIGLSVFNAVDGVWLKPDIRRKRKPNKPPPVKLRRAKAGSGTPTPYSRQPTIAPRCGCAGRMEAECLEIGSSPHSSPADSGSQSNTPIQRRRKTAQLCG